MLPKSAVDRILNYPYASNDQSIFVKYIKNICRYIIDLIPTTISPNVITTTGLCLVLFSTIIQHVFVSVYSALFAALSLFIYQLLDDLDGMQGKRTNMYNNPTTEIFDHGCDSINMVLTVLNVISIFGINYYLSVLLLLSSLTIFYMPTWEHRHTGVMNFRSGGANPTESLLMTQLSFVLAALFPSIKCYTVHLIITLGVFFTALKCIRDSFNTINKPDAVNTLIPLIVTYIYGAFVVYHEQNILLITIPWLTATLELIWAEITYLNYNLVPFLCILSLQITLKSYSLILTVPLYMYQFLTHVWEVCYYYKMPHWYSLQPVLEHHNSTCHANGNDNPCNIRQPDKVLHKRYISKNQALKKYH
jgi:hypothetical protein